MWVTVSRLHRSLNPARSQDLHNLQASKQLNTTAIRVPSLKMKHHEGKREELNKWSAEDLETVLSKPHSFHRFPHSEGPCHLEILNNLRTMGPTFSFCTEPDKLWGWPCLSTTPSYFYESESIRPFPKQRKEIHRAQRIQGGMMKEQGPLVGKIANLKTKINTFPYLKVQWF